MGKKKKTVETVTSLRLDRVVVDRCKKLQSVMQQELAEAQDLTVEIRIPLYAVVDRAVREALEARGVDP